MATVPSAIFLLPCAMEELGQTAIYYATQLGWPVFPLRPRGKTPLTQHGYLDATTDLATIERWWTEHPNANIGLPTGTHFDVIDIDPRHDGDATWEELCTSHEYVPRPQTAIVNTGGGGIHIYYQPLQGMRCRSIGTGLDYKTAGGYVVAPPSIHPSGCRYDWEYEPARGIAEMPAWLVEYIREQCARPASGVETVSPEKIPEGRRHIFLVSRAGHLRNLGYVGAHLTEALRTLNRLWCDPPVPDDEIERISLSVSQYEQHGDQQDHRYEIVYDYELSRAVTDSIRALLDHEAPVYYYGHCPVIINRHLAEVVASKISRPKNSLSTEVLSVPRIMLLLDRVAKYYTVNRRGEKRRVQVPRLIAELLVSATDAPYHTLNFVTNTPVLSHSGEIVQTIGYNRATGIYYDPYHVYDAIPETVSYEQAQEQLKILQYPFTDFPFVAPYHFSRALAALLTVVGRSAIDGPVPLFAITAPTPETGKSQLVSAISLIALGRMPAIWYLGKTEEEIQKQLLSLAIASDRLVLLDNYDGLFGTPSLTATISSAAVKGRILGRNDTREMPFISVVFLTGNNIRFRADISRRVVNIHLDSGLEFPGQRQFTIPCLNEHLYENHPRYLSAALMILRAFYCAGTPQVERKPFPSFEAWDRIIRGCILWLGLQDPLMNIFEERRLMDADIDSASQLILTLSEIFNGQDFSTNDIIERMKLGDELGLKLQAMLAEAIGDKITPRNMGYFLRHWRDRPCSGRKISATKRSQGGMRWCIVEC